MVDLAENNVVRFKNITRRKDGIFVNFRVKGLSSGTAMTALISVDISAVDLDPADPLEKIVAECARLGVQEFQKSNFQFEGIGLI
ncbi:hypothetical protein JYU14_04100 [Simkania negevensis]|uniref:Uncharacterized protein n=1 Tax=Simkania negevensis TaxID=83561 RepID=A0ABS3AR82_9BACT|nr:hypothetical protein [Simkania negevensis]